MLKYHTCPQFIDQWAHPKKICSRLRRTHKQYITCHSKFMIFHKKIGILGEYLYEIHTLFILYLEGNHTFFGEKLYFICKFISGNTVYTTFVLDCKMYILLYMLGSPSPMPVPHTKHFLLIDWRLTGNGNNSLAGEKTLYLKTHCYECGLFSVHISNSPVENWARVSAKG